MTRREQFQHDGYLIVEDLLSPECVDLLSKEIDRIVANAHSLPADLSRQITFERDLSSKQRGDVSAEDAGAAIFLIGELPRFSPRFLSLLFYPPLLDLLESIFGGSEFEYHYSTATIKSARVGSRISWHRDHPNEYMSCLDSNSIRVMLCLDGMSADNGATKVIRGSHQISGDKAADDRGPWPEENIVTLTCGLGAAVVLGSRIIHGGDPNRSSTPRRNLISQWGGPGNYLVSAEREVYTGLMPRSREKGRQAQCAYIRQHSLLPSLDEMIVEVAGDSN